MKVILLTNADSIFCKEYVKYVLLGKFEVLIVSSTNKQYCNYYLENGIKVLCYSNVDKLAKQLENKVCSDDIFHVHYVETNLLKKLWKPWLRCKRRFLSYWGSDLLRASPRQMLTTLPFLYSADAITVINNVMKKYIFKTKWERIKCIDFGNSIFEKIDSVYSQMSTEDCKKKFGFDTEKIIIFVGYNAVREQQHLEIMKEMIKIPKELIEKVCFVFHFGYGISDGSYLRQLKSFLSESNISFRIISQFMNKDDIAMLRVSADIFLYGQTTDALSSSVIEYLYAGSILVKPIWLDYSELKEKGVEYYEYAQFDELPQLLIQIISQGVCKTNKGLKIKKVLRNLSSWDRLTPKWLSLYSIGGSKSR